MWKKYAFQCHRHQVQTAEHPHRTRGCHRPCRPQSNLRFNFPPHLRGFCPGPSRRRHPPVQLATSKRSSLMNAVKLCTMDEPPSLHVAAFEAEACATASPLNSPTPKSANIIQPAQSAFSSCLKTMTQSCTINNPTAPAAPAQQSLRYGPFRP